MVEKKFWLEGITIDPQSVCEICGKTMEQAKSMLILRPTNRGCYFCSCKDHVGTGRLGEQVELVQ